MGDINHTKRFWTSLAKELLSKRGNKILPMVAFSIPIPSQMKFNTGMECKKDKQHLIIYMHVKAERPGSDVSSSSLSSSCG